MIVVWTPTIRPGLDVAVESVRRQVCRDRVYWVLGDDFPRDFGAYKQADGVLDYIFQPRKLTHAKYSYVAGHNEALKIARALDADLFVLLIDYTYVPEDGVQRFIDMADRHPDCLLTGIAHRSADPPASLITDPDGHYTIFAEPYTSKPQQVPTGRVFGTGRPDWWDERLDRATPQVREQCIEPIRWEANWAAIPKRVLMDERLNYDEAYDEYHGHDNIDFAFRAAALGYRTWIDYDNVSIRLPKQTYWPEEDRQMEVDRKRAQEFFYNRPDAPQLFEPASVDEPGIGHYYGIKVVNLFEHLAVSERVPAIRRWRSVLCPHGELYVVVPAGSMDRGDLQLAFASAGFRRSKAEYVDGHLEGVAQRGTTDDN